MRSNKNEMLEKLEIATVGVGAVDISRSCGPLEAKL
jgi:hypothetical protein